MKRILQLSLISLALGASVFTLGHASSAAALIGGSTSKSEACKGINLDQNTDACASNTPAGLNTLLSTVISILSIVVGAAAIIMIIIGGFKYITSQGDSSSTASARNTVLYALVGLLVAIFAQAMVHLVLNRAGTASKGSSIFLQHGYVTRLL